MRKRTCVGQQVVDPFQHDVLERNAPRIVGARIFAARSQKLFNRIFLIEWNQDIAQLVGRGMQAHRKLNAEFLSDMLNHRNHPRG